MAKRKTTKTKKKKTARKRKTVCCGRPSRAKLIRLFVAKGKGLKLAGQGPKKRIYY